MNKQGFNIRIFNDKMGSLVNETFMDQVQFKLFLKMVHGCLELKNNLTFFNGFDFLVNVPYRFLEDSVIVTKMEGEFELADHMKSKIEALVTK